MLESFFYSMFQNKWVNQMQLSFSRHQAYFGNKNQKQEPIKKTRLPTLTQAVEGTDTLSTPTPETNKSPSKLPAYLLSFMSLFPGLSSAADFWKTPSATESMKGKIMANLSSEYSITGDHKRMHLLRGFYGLGDLFPGVKDNNTLILGLPMMDSPIDLGWLVGTKTILTPFPDERPNLKMTFVPLFMKPPRGDKVNINAFALIGDTIGPLKTRIDAGINYTRTHMMPGMHKMNMPTKMGDMDLGMTDMKPMNANMNMPNMSMNKGPTETLSPVLSIDQPLVGLNEDCSARAELNFKPKERGGYSILGGKCKLPKNPIANTISGGFDLKNDAVLFMFNKKF